MQLVQCSGRHFTHQHAAQHLTSLLIHTPTTITHAYFLTVELFYLKNVISMGFTLLLNFDFNVYMAYG
jgi:hypothetical protein